MAGLYDLFWFTKWAPDFGDWLQDWHGVPRRCMGPFPGDYTAIFLDVVNSPLRSEAIRHLNVHIAYDPAKHTSTELSRWGEISPSGERYLWRGDAGLDYVVHGPHGSYRVVLQVGSAPVVPRWERMTKEEAKALEDDMQHPERVVGDASRWPTVPA